MNRNHLKLIFTRIKDDRNYTPIWLPVFLLVSLVLFSVDVQAQSKTGTTIGQFLLIEPSAHYTGMGNAGVASYDEISAAYYNPGAIGRFRSYAVQFTHSMWLADISYDYGAVLIPMGPVGNLMLNVTSLNSGEIAVRTVDQPLGTGERYSVTNFAIGMGYGRQFTDRFSMGVQVTYINESIWHSSLSTVGLSVGTLYNLTSDGVRVGASISNFGLPARYSGRDLRIVYDNDSDKYGDNSSLPGEIYTEKYPLPVLFRVGLSWPILFSDNNQVQLAVNAFHPNDNTESMSFGAEWTLLKVFALRAGYQNLFLEDSEVGLTFGLGLNLEWQGRLFHFDYAWADHGRLENTQRFTLGFMF